MESVSHSSSVSGLSSIVSAVIKRRLDDSYLLRDYEGKGLWLPCTDVKSGETCITAAQRLGFEVCLNNQLVFNSLLLLETLYSLY